MSFSHFYFQQIFCEKLCSMIIWSWNQNSFFSFLLLISLRFRTFSIDSPKTELFISLKSSFSKWFFAAFLKSVLILIYSFNQVFWLNLITLCTFLNTNPWFKACFKFLILIKYSVLSGKLAFWHFQSLFTQGKIADRFGFYKNFQGIEFQL